MNQATVSCPLCGAAGSHFLTAPDRFHWRTDEYELLRCPSCTCVWLLQPPTPEQMGVHYDEDYHRLIAAGGEVSAMQRWQRPRAVIVDRKSGGAILDIGCSSGGFLGTLKGGSWKLHGIEMEATTAEKARAATGAEVFVGDAMDAPFAPGSFDVITSFDVLEHVYHPREFLSKVLEWLKPGGIYYVALPNIDSWEARLLGSYWYGLELPRHTFHFSPRSLRYVMNSLGFEEVEISTPPTSYLERSASYLYAALIEKAGASPVPMAKEGRRGVASRAVRKAVRMSLVEPLGTMASWKGAGASMEAVFAKPICDCSAKAKAS